MADPIRGVVGFSLWNLIIIGIVALVAVTLYNMFLSGKVVFGIPLGRA